MNNPFKKKDFSTTLLVVIEITPYDRAYFTMTYIIPNYSIHYIMLYYIIKPLGSHLNLWFSKNATLEPARFYDGPQGKHDE